MKNAYTAFSKNTNLKNMMQLVT